MNQQTLLQRGALSAAQIATLQGWKIDASGGPLYVPDNALSAEEQQIAITVNEAIFMLAQQQLAAAPGSQITFGAPFTIIPPIK